MAVRLVLPHEYGKYRTHLKALDTESKTLRFGVPVTNEAIDALCDKIEENKDEHILFCVENDLLEFVAVGHIAKGNETELAFSVWKQHQGQGLGSALMKRVIQYCRTHGILKGCMVCLSHNQAIKHLCTKHGIKIHSEHGETLADVELEQPSITTFVSEATDANLGVMDYVGKRMPKPWTFKS